MLVQNGAKKDKMPCKNMALDNFIGAKAKGDVKLWNVKNKNVLVLEAKTWPLRD